MSRYVIVIPKDEDEPGVEVACGWDGPLQTFFVQVTVSPAAGEEEPHIPLWEGKRWRQLNDVDRLAALMAPWAALPADTRSRLQADQAADRRSSGHPIASALFPGLNQQVH